jgi:hypothetical protein
MTLSEHTPVTDELRSRSIRFNLMFVEIGAIITVWYWLIASWWSGTIIPGGLEFSRSMHSLFFWQNWMQCGECAYWGNLNGGGPTLQDAYGSFLHPIAAISTLQLGAIAGSAVTVSLSFLMMALASWWFAYHLKIHVVARVWFAFANMLGGHMLCRLELGNIGLALSLASAWLAIVVLVWFIEQPNLLRAVIFAITLASACLAGQGYMQIILFSMMPIFGIYAWQKRFFELPRVHSITYAGVVIVLTALLVAPLWLNLIQPNVLYVKETSGDDYYYQPITRLFANLLIDDFDVAKSDVYNNYPYPWVYSTFIGLASVVFALSGLYWITNARNRLFYKLFMCMAMWTVLIAAGVPFQIAQYIPSEELQIAISGLRYLVVANGYFALAMLVMAMLSINAVLTETHWWPDLLRRVFARVPAHFVLPIAITIILLVNLQQMYQYNKSWLDDVNGYDEKQQATIDVLKSDEFALIDAPDWMIMPLLQNNFKITGVVIPWQTPLYALPEPRYILAMEQPENSEFVAVQDENWSLYRKLDSTAAYAVVFHDDGTSTACTTTAQSGDVRVDCMLTQPGELRISEFYVPGWQAKINGNDVPINTNPKSLTDNVNMVRLDTPTGTSEIQFVFRPWHATMGMIGYFIGWTLSLVLLLYAVFFRTSAKRIA